jgi:hypothetical protein
VAAQDEDYRLKYAQKKAGPFLILPSRPMAKTMVLETR